MSASVTRMRACLYAVLALFLFGVAWAGTWANRDVARWTDDTFRSRKYVPHE